MLTKERQMIENAARIMRKESFQKLMFVSTGVCIIVLSKVMTIITDQAIGGF
jgi:hypothetical protein